MCAMTTAQDKFVKDNIGTARTVAAKFSVGNLHYDDLLGESMLGLVEAAVNYDSAKGAASYHAYWQCTYACQRYLCGKKSGRIGGKHTVSYDALLESDFDRYDAMAVAIEHSGNRYRERVHSALRPPVKHPGIGTGGVQKLKTHCPLGHEYTTANTYIDRATRRCRVCKNQQRRDKRLRAKTQN